MSSTLRNFSSALLLVLTACGGGGSDDSPPPNVAPTVANATLTVAEDQAGSVSIQATDPNNDALTATVTGNPTKGTVSLTGSNPFTFSFTPNPDANGADTFTFRVADPSGAAATASVAITITPQNDAPTVGNSTLTINEDVAGTVSVTAADIDADALSATISAQPASGTAAVTGSNPFTISYTPLANHFGADAFSVRVSDGSGGVATSAVTVTINPVADAPIVTTTVLASEDTVATGILATDADGDPVTLTQITAPMHGTLSLLANGYSYTPDSNYFGADTFAVTASDGTLSSPSTQVGVQIAAVNDPPVAVGESASIAAAGATDINVLVNDTDIDGDTLTIEILESPPGASAVAAGGVVRVTPAAGATGPTKLTYRISDSHGGTATAEVRVVIGHASPLFFTAGAASPATKRIYRYDFLSPPVALDTPLPAGATLERFTTAANGSWMVYVSRQNGPPVRHRLWLKNLDDLSAGVVEIPTDATFFTNYLRISPDGFLVVFNDRYAPTPVPGFVQDVDPGNVISNPTFTRNGQRLFYTVLLPGGGRIIKRADVPLTGVLANRLQMTQTYGVAEGLGYSLLLTPDETRILSTGLFVVGAPVNAVKLHSFVTTADGSQDDTRLHAPLVGLLDGAGQALSTPDSNYAFGVSTVNGLSTADSTNLSTPGTHVTIASTVNQIQDLRMAGDSQTVFFTIDGILPINWKRGQINQFGSHVPFQPAGGGAAAPRVVQPAPDGSAVVFDSGAAVYGVLGGQYVTPTLLYTRGTTAIPNIRYAPDSTSVAVANPGETGLVILNPKALGWFEVLSQPNSQPLGAACLAFAGEDC